jgi:plastocyanin
MKQSLFLVAAAIVLVACGGSSNDSLYGGTAPNNDPSPTTANTINANPAIDFKPSALTVAAGTTVTFNFGSTAHTVTFTTAGAPTSIPATANAQVGVLFPAAGIYAFHCTIHPQMTGVVTVQ